MFVIILSKYKQTRHAALSGCDRKNLEKVKVPSLNKFRVFSIFIKQCASFKFWTLVLWSRTHNVILNSLSSLEQGTRAQRSQRWMPADRTC